MVAACGIGNPQAFWRTLEGLGAELVERVEFADHHAYGEAEAERLAKRARDLGTEGVVITCKDAVKLSQWGEAFGTVRCWALRIDVALDALASAETIFARALSPTTAGSDGEARPRE